MANYKDYLNQAANNFYFLDKNCRLFPDDFYAWKIIVCFYCSMQLIKAFLLKNYKITTRSHPEIEFEINSDKGKTRIKEHAWKAYRNLRVESEKCRYDGHSDIDLWNSICKDELTNCLERLEVLNNEMTKKKMEVPFTNKKIKE